MNRYAAFGALLLQCLAMACGSGASDTVLPAATAAAVSVAMGNALSSALAAQPQLAPGDRADAIDPARLAIAAADQVLPGVEEAARLAATGRSTAASTVTCSATCTYTCTQNGCVANAATVTTTCAFQTDAMPCDGGGTYQGNGDIKMTVACGPPAQLSSENIRVGVNFNNCGVTLPNGAGTVVVSNDPGQSLLLQATAGANGANVSGSVTAAGLHVKGTLCGKQVSSDCRISYSMTFGGSPSGSFCDCVMSNLGSADVCTPQKCG